MRETMGQTAKTAAQPARSGNLFMLRLLCAAALLAGLATCSTGPPERRHAYPQPCIWPTPSSAREVTSEFGEIRTAGGGGHRRHQGIDIRAPKGWPVYATADGTVSKVDRDWGGYGKHIVLQHPSGYSTLYAHLSECDVKQGDRVHAGQVIGQIGKTGRSTGYHLHYEVRRNNTAVNPRLFLP